MCIRDRFKGVFDRNARKVLAFSSDGRANGVKKVSETEAELGDPALDEPVSYTHLDVYKRQPCTSASSGKLTDAKAS